jgi:hypothetical protein
MPAGLARCYAGHHHQRAVPDGQPAPRGSAAGPSPASAGRQQTPAPLAGQVTITSPGAMESRRGVPARLQIEGSAGLAYRATGVPPAW